MSIYCKPSDGINFGTVPRINARRIKNTYAVYYDGNRLRGDLGGWGWSIPEVLLQNRGSKKNIYKVIISSEENDKLQRGMNFNSLRDLENRSEKVLF